jgi:hypothetical protein
MRSLSGLAALAGLVLLVLAAPASAKTVTATDVKLSGTTIGCYAVQYGGKGIECMADFIDTGELDGYVGLRATGPARRSERGDYPGYGNKRVFLRRGDVWLRKGIRCVVGRRAISCRNTSGRGFRLQRGATRLY